jgi:hypothetical protein
MDELEDFKTRINLSEYAAMEGYTIDRKASSRNSVVMRHASGDKIVIARGSDDHWIYFSVRSDTDNGSIIDFVQNRKGLTLGAVRLELRPWIGASVHIARPHPDLFAQTVERITKDRARVLLELARMKPLLTHRYLEAERGIPGAVLRSARFAGKIRMDFRGNAIFPHTDHDGPCGYEIKNPGFTGFAKGGEKGLWFSAVNRADSALVIAESAIDALSHAVLHPDECARYASIGGAMNPNQPALIQSAIQRLGEGARLILATDNDEDGRKLAETIAAFAGETGRQDIQVVFDLPEGEGNDWNAVLQGQLRSGVLKSVL